MYSPDGKYIISGSQALCIWENDLGNNYVYDVFPGNLTDMDLRGDGRSIVVALDDGEIRLYKMYAYTENSLAFQEHTGEGFGVSIAFSPSGEVLASTSGGLENNGDTRIELWNAQDFSFLDYLDLKDATDGEIITSIDFSMNGDVLVAGTSAQRIFIWDLATRELLGEPLTDLTGAVSRVRFTPDGRHLISLDSTPALRVWTIEDTSGEKTRINRDARVLELEKSDSLANLLVIIPQGESCPFAISPDGKQIALKGANNTIRLLDLDLFQEMGDPLQGAPSQIMDFTFSPDGSMLAGSSYDGSILIWDLFTHEQIGQVMTGHQGAVQKLIFSDDGKVLFSASDDGTIRLWDVESQLPIGQPISNNATALAAMYRGMDPMTAPGGFKDSRILDMAKSPNGSVLVISNEQKFLWTLDLAPESWSQRACFIAGRNFNSEEWDLYLPNEPYHESCPSAIVQPLAIRSQVQSAIEYGKSLVKQGDIEGALAYYPQGGPLDSEAGITADQWNHLCWYGSIWGYPNEVMYACENAVAAAPSNGAIRDSRGLTRALIGDFEGAIEDFHFFVQWARETDQESFAEEIVQREAWMAELEAGRNPIDDATLKAYR
jgi:WD40 repeat protein